MPISNRQISNRDQQAPSGRRSTQRRPDEQPLGTAGPRVHQEHAVGDELVVGGVPAQNELAYRAHEQIYKAIAARDANRAERLIRAHLGQVSATYWKMLERS